MRVILFSLACSFLFSCGDGEDHTTNAEGPAMAPVENVNGKIPDTTNSVTIGEPSTDSSTVQDSIRR